MRAVFCVLISVFLLAACGEDKPKSSATAAFDAVKSASDKLAAGAKNAVDAIPTGVKHALPTFGNFSQMCAQCHTGDDVKRYEQTFLPMYQMMFNPSAWVDPNAYGQAMQPMIDPETYTKWYNAWMKMAPVPQAGAPAK